MKHQTKIIEKVNSSFIKEWNSLWVRSENANVFNSHGWFRSHTDGRESVVFACYENKRLVGVCPFIKGKIYGVSCLVSPGKSYIGNIPLLVEKYDNEILKSFLTKLSNYGGFCITNIEENVAKDMFSVFQSSFFSLISVIPYLNLQENYIEKMSKSNSKEMNKIIRLNAKDLELKIYKGNDLEKSLEILTAIEQNSSKKKKDMDIFSKTKNKEIYERITKYCRYHVRIAFLYYNNVPISYQFGFLCKNTFSAYQTAFLEEYKNINPGRVMLFLLFQKLSQSKVKLIDLGGGISSYKESFTPDHFCMYDMYFSKNPIKMLWWKSINMARRKKQIMLPKKFTRDHEFLFRTI